MSATDLPPHGSAASARIARARIARARIARARLSVIAVFFLNGLALSTFITRAPSLKADHHLDDGQVGLIGLVFGLAAIVAMQFVGSLVARHGSRRILRTALALMSGALVVVGLTGGVVDYALAAMALAASHGMTDAAMNAHAVAVERAGGRPVLNRCHGAWSVSAVVASLVTALVVHAGVSTLADFTGTALVVLVVGLVIGGTLLSREADTDTAATGVEGEPSKPGWRTGWTRMVVLLGITGMLLMVCEGAALGWGAIFLHDDKGATVALASIAVTSYEVGQTMGRSVGDRLKQRYSTRTLFRGGGIAGAVGLVVALTSGGPLVGIAGFGIFGLGASLLVPLAFGAVGHAGAAGPGAATFISRFTTLTYAGVLLGPGLIGWAADIAGLTTTLAALVPILVGVAFLSRLPEPPVGEGGVGPDERMHTDGALDVTLASSGAVEVS